MSAASSAPTDKTVLKKVRDTLVAAKPNWIAMEYNTIEKMGAGDFKATSDWNGSALRQRLANSPSTTTIRRKATACGAITSRS